MLEAGDYVGRYELVTMLGRGGMGEVWEAVLHGPQGFRKPIALKLVKDGGAGESAKRSLIEEARLGALLSHPNVVATHELGQYEGRWYIAMELVRGASVADLSREKPLSGAALLDVGVQVCAALAHVHGLEIDGKPAKLVHRDVKPQNLLVDRSGLVKLADLGVARLSGLPGTLGGTPGYMPLEQAEGEEDGRADLFALGITLYRLLMGRLPFQAGAVGLLRPRVIRDAIAHAAWLAPLDAAAPGLSAVLARCLQPDVEDRWPDAVSLGAALRALRLNVPAGESLLELLARHRGDVPSAGTPTGSDALTQASARPQGRVPEARDRFVGRSAEVGQVSALLREERLVTLLGPGGTGKTRLASEIARPLRRGWPGGAWFVDLSSAVSVDGLVSAVAGVLGVPVDTSDPVDGLGRALEARGHALLVLDNVEQVVDAAAAPIQRWLEVAPKLVVLATSQIALRLRGERTVALGPLSREDGVALWLARAPRPPADVDRPLLDELVDRLDGLPLAIELAASRSRVMSVRMLRDRLEDRFRLLATDARELPARHRSLRASLDLSYELLPPEGRAALLQLGVFSGSFTLEAAEAVLDLSECGWALDSVHLLVDHSLVRVESEHDRFRLLLGVRDYALARATPEERAAAEARHGAYYAQMGHPDAMAALDRRGGHARMKGLRLDLDNLVDGATRAVARGDALAAAGCTTAACRILLATGPIAVARSLLQATLALELPPAWALPLGWTLAHAHRALGDVDEAERIVLRGIERARELGDGRQLGIGLRAMAARLHDSGRFDESKAFAVESREAFRSAGAALEYASGAADLAIYARRDGDLDLARALLHEALAAIRQAGLLIGESRALGTLGLVEMMAGDLDATADLLARAIVLAEEAGEARLATHHRNNLGLALLRRGRTSEAEEVLREVLAFALHVGERRMNGIARSHLAGVCVERGRTAEALAELTEASHIAAELGDRRSIAVTAVEMADALRLGGHLAEAGARIEEARSLYAAAGLPLDAPFQCVLGAVFVDTGQAVAARAALLDGLGLVTRGNGWFEADILAELARAELALHDLPAAAEAADRAVEVARRLVRVPSLGTALCAVAEVAFAAGDAQRARTAVAEAREIAARMGLGPDAPLARRLAGIA